MQTYTHFSSEKRKSCGMGHFYYHSSPYNFGISLFFAFVFVLYTYLASENKKKIKIHVDYKVEDVRYSAFYCALGLYYRNVWRKTYHRFNEFSSCYPSSFVCSFVMWPIIQIQRRWWKADRGNDSKLKKTWQAQQRGGELHSKESDKKKFYNNADDMHLFRHWLLIFQEPNKRSKLSKQRNSFSIEEQLFGFIVCMYLSQQLHKLPNSICLFMILVFFIHCLSGSFFPASPSNSYRFLSSMERCILFSGVQWLFDQSNRL